MLRNILIFILIFSPVFAQARSVQTETSPTPNPAVQILIDELGLRESAIASRDLPGWSPPKKVVIRNIDSAALAEHAIAMMFALARGLDIYHSNQINEGKWQRNNGMLGVEILELEGRTLLVVGLGGIGTQVAKRAHGLGMKVLANSHLLADVSADDSDAVFYPGGHGPLWDLTDDADSIALIETMYAAGKPVSAVCHAPAVFRKTQAEDGSPIVEGKSVTGFRNSEEDAVELTDVVPFLLEDELIVTGGNYSKGPDWQPYVLTDGNIITGQNPASSEQVAQAVMAAGN